MDTKIIGNITELSVSLYITRLGYQVSIPYGDRSRYDQIWDINGKLIRVQVKTAKDLGDSISITCHSTNKSKGKLSHRSYTPNEVDCISTFYNNKVYVIPISEIPSRTINLRYTDTKNKQKSGVRYLDDYTVEKYIDRGMEQ